MTPPLNGAAAAETMTSQPPILLGKPGFATLILLCLLIWPFFLAQSETEEGNFPPPAEETGPALALSDCPKCHHAVASLLEANGGAHKSKVTCLNCHEGHPPAVRGIIPRCSKCHRERPHFELSDCLFCHTNPHTPLKITLNHQTTGPCTTCHTRQIQELREHPSIHTSLDCTACHTRHGYLPECFRCHAPHLPTMTLKDCRGCHQPHMPLQVTYPATTPSEFCGACHKTVYAQLATSRAKHRQLLCVACHVERHKTIPACKQCHTAPHPPAMLEKFTACGNCHGLAHDLKLNKIDVFLEKEENKSRPGP